MIERSCAFPRFTSTVRARSLSTNVPVTLAGNGPSACARRNGSTDIGYDEPPSEPQPFQRLNGDIGSPTVD